MKLLNEAWPLYVEVFVKFEVGMDVPPVALPTSQSRARLYLRGNQKNVITEKRVLVPIGDDIMLVG